MAVSTAPRTVNLSPVSLSYIAALRGIRPRASGTAFTYAQVDCGNPQALICCAASNPEGQFFGIMPDAEAVAKANKLASLRHTQNIAFLSGAPSELLTQKLLPALDYLVGDETGQPLSSTARESLFAFAEKAIKPGGLLTYLYRTYANPDEILRFLVSEFAPEMNVDQAKDFLLEIKALGKLYFDEHSITRETLDRALANGAPAEFFAACGLGGKAGSGTLDVMAGLLPRHFAFAGSADVSANYMELATPPSAHDTLEKCRDHLLYEPLKDFAMNRLVRHDIWCRLPADQTSSTAELFGPFTYGIVRPRDEVPAIINALGKTIDLGQPLLANMIDVMTSLPMSIGDFLKHPKGKGVDPAEAVAAIQILVATGLAQPMRSHHQGQGAIQLAQLRWATEFNSYLNDTSITSAGVLLASQVIGGGISVPARDALVMQAINRVGMANSAGALLIELERIALDPSLASLIMDVAEPTAALADNIMQDVVERSIVQWYAYGLLAA